MQRRLGRIGTPDLEKDDQPIAVDLDGPPHASIPGSFVAVSFVHMIASTLLALKMRWPSGPNATVSAEGTVAPDGRSVHPLGCAVRDGG
jgi:hypothetical protein